jgi:hypothetical protein
MKEHAVVKTSRADPRTPGSPPAVWAAFVTQNAWKSWTIVGLLTIVVLLCIALARLASRPPEFVMVDANGRTTPVRRSVATDALLRFLADRTRPPEMAIVRFTRDFLHLALGLNSSTIDANWPAALGMMAPELRERIARESAAKRLVETYRLAQRKTELSFDEIVIEDQSPTHAVVRATITRRSVPLVDGAGPPSDPDRVQVELLERIVQPTMERPDGLEVQEWRLIPFAPGATSDGSIDVEQEAPREER